MSNEIEWQRAFIRSGFVSREENGEFHFDQENYKSEEFLVSIFKELNLLDDYKNKIFSPSSTAINESDWLTAIGKLRTGVESGDKSDMDNIDLHLMDTYMAGIVRWINAAGIKTTGSCDGHSGVRRPHLDFADRDEEILFNYFLSSVSAGNWRFMNRHLKRADENPRADVEAGYDQSWFLDVAEKIHQHQSSLHEFVEAGKKLKQNVQVARM